MVVRDRKPTPFDLEPDMSSQRRETDKPKPKAKPQSEKKTETTILSPEELRAISGGSQLNPPPPKPNTIIKH